MYIEEVDHSKSSPGYEECNYDMVDLTGLDQQHSPNESCVTQGNDVNDFNINIAIDASTIVQSSENPYYVGMYDINLEDSDINETNDGSSIVCKTDNPYYGQLDDIELVNNNIDEEI